MARTSISLLFSQRCDGGYGGQCPQSPLFLPQGSRGRGTPQVSTDTVGGLRCGGRWGDALPPSLKSHHLTVTLSSLPYWYWGWGPPSRWRRGIENTDSGRYLCAIDSRAAEAYETALSTSDDCSDTRFSMSVDDIELSPNMQELPTEKAKWTEMTSSLTIKSRSRLYRAP